MDTSMMRVYPEDREKMTEIFGKPTQRAFRLMLTTMCPHPEGARQYLTVEFPGAGDDALVEGHGRKMAGYLCRQCRCTVFPEQA